MAESETAGAAADFLGALTDGVGFTLHSGDEFVDFRLANFTPTLPVTIGEIDLFLTPEGTVKYESDNRLVKEEIILDERPALDKVFFNLASSELVPEPRADGGFDLYGGGGDLAFTVTAPTVVDARGKEGRASLSLNQGAAVISIDPAFLDEAVYPIVVDPSVIAAVTAGAGLASQRNTFFDGQRYRVIYSDGAALVSKYSSDGRVWSSPSVIDGAVNSGVYTASWFDGNNKVYIAYIETNGYSILARRGTIDGTSISWSDPTTVLTGSSTTNRYSFPSISRDSSGKIWVSARHYNGSDPLNPIYKIRARRSSSADSITSWEAAVDVSPGTNGQMLIPQILPLAGNGMYFLYLYGSALRGKRYTGSSWDTEQAIASVPQGTQSLVPSGVVDASGTIVMGYADNTGGNIKYKTLSGPSYGSWSAPADLAADSGESVALTLDTSENRIWASYTQTIGGTGKQLRQVKLGEPKRKTILGTIKTPFAKVTAVSGGGAGQSYVTEAAADEAPADVKNPSNYLIDAANSKFWVYSPEKIDYVNVRLSTVGAGISNLRGYYTNDSGTPQLPSGSFKDNTANFTLADGDITVTPPADWKKEANGLYRLIVLAPNTPSVRPVGTQIIPYPDISQVMAAYSTQGDPFFAWREGRNGYRINFSRTRDRQKLGEENPTASFGKDLKSARAQVDLETGNLTLNLSGPSTPSRGIPTAPTFTYNSQSDYESALGYGWTSNLFARLYVGWTDGSVLFEDFSGARHLFDYNAGAYEGPPELHMTLTKSGSDYLLKTKSQITYTFDQYGKLKTVKDRNNNASVYNYDSSSRLTSVVSASNTTTTLTYDASSRLTAVTDSAGRSLSFGYGQSGDLTETVDAMGARTNFTYDANRNLNTFRNALGHTTAFTYTGDKLTRITDPSPLNYQTNFTYNRTSTSVDGPRTDVADIATYSFSPEGLKTSVTEPSPGGTTTYKYDGDWNATQTTKANGAKNTKTYDASGNVLTETNALSKTTTHKYNATNDITETVDPLGNRTRYEYDTNGNLYKTIDALDNSETVVYGQYGLKTSKTNKRGYTTSYVYNDLGLVTTETDPHMGTKVL